MTSSASRRAALRSVQVLLVAWMVFSCLGVARASRILHQTVSCVVLGNNELRRCGVGCECQGKSPSGSTCFCQGQCDASFKQCDGAKDIQANCDCSSSSLGAGVNNALKPVTAAVNEAVTPPPPPVSPPKKAPAPTPVTPAAPIHSNPTGLVQRAANPLYTIGGGNPATGGSPIGFSLGNGQLGIGSLGIPIIG